MTDQNTEPVPPLVAAAAAIDERLPAAWSRVAEYLVAYGDPTGTLGKRKAADDRTAVLDAGDLHTILDALETAIVAASGPDELAQHHTVSVVADHYVPATDPDTRPVPWLYLRCDTADCGWWLGFDQEYSPAELLQAAEKHETESLSRPTAEEPTR